MSESRATTLPRWLSLIVDGPLFVIRLGLTLFRIYLVIAVAGVSLAMAVLFISLLLRQVFGVRWGW